LNLDVRWDNVRVDELTSFARLSCARATVDPARVDEQQRSAEREQDENDENTLHWKFGA
jgi:hypothetical protein